MIKSYSKAGTKGGFSEEYTTTPDAVKANEPADAGSVATPEALLRRYELLGKGLWVAMGAGLLIVLWTVAAFVIGPATPSALPATTGMESTTEPEGNQDTTPQDNLPPQTEDLKTTEDQKTTEPETLPVDNQQQPNVAKPQTQKTVRKAPDPVTNKVQPKTQKNPEQKQQEETQPDEPKEEQLYQQQQLQKRELPKSAY